MQPAGTYKVDTDEELIDGLSFLAYRRIATWIHLPSIATKTGASQLISVQPSDLEAAHQTISGVSASATRADSARAP